MAIARRRRATNNAVAAVAAGAAVAAAVVGAIGASAGRIISVRTRNARNSSVRTNPFMRSSSRSTA